ncbi:MAG: hypothetical protein AAGG07_14420 [Planctomycetota bacterium]
MRNAIFVAAVVAAAGSAQAGLANQLANAGFEMAPNYDGNDVGNWAAFFGGADFQQVEIVDQPFAGDFSLQIGTFNTPNTFAGATQRVAVQGGLESTFSFYARSVVANGALYEYRIEWRDAAGDFIGDQFALNTALNATTDWEQYGVTAVAPANAEFASVVIAVQTFGGSAPHEGFSQFDNASFTQVPAPAGAALLGLAGFAARRRRG